MAMIRQNSKFLLTLRALAVISRLFIAFIFIGLISSFALGNVKLQNTIVIDPLSGFAMNSYDPVSYYINDAPKLGIPEYEFIWQGVSWLFVSEANRDIFVKQPEVYAPLFGGHGVMGLARGYISDGNPHIYEILGNKLFLFYSSANRDAFMLSQRSNYIKAQKNWEFFLTQN